LNSRLNDRRPITHLVQHHRSKQGVYETGSSPYVGDGSFVIRGARGAEALHDLSIPTRYADGIHDGITQSVALAYRRLASDLREGTHFVPTFDDAVDLHRLIDRVGRSSSYLLRRSV
jgi:hypothetical protein